MVYESAKDMFLDNRRGLEDDIKHLSEKDKANVLSAYDWAVCQALTFQKSHNNFKEELIKRSDNDLVEKIERATCMRFMEIGELAHKYVEDVKSGKRVGYSAEQEQVEQED